VKVKIDEIRFDKESYPRDGFDNETVNSYMLNLDKLPPIVVTKDKILVDGYHRLLAHRLAGSAEIEVEVVDVPQDQILLEATRRNSLHGKQLTRAEKQRLARHFYKSNHLTLSEISNVLAVSQGTLSNWLKDLINQEKEELKKQIIDLYLQCYTQEEIANKVGISQGRVAQIISKFKTEKINSPPIPESLQLFNIWYFPSRDKRYGMEMEGAIPGQIVENVLHYYTQPFDLVVDPMAGSGTTIDVCKAMYRRYLAYDIAPKRDDVKKHDIRQKQKIAI
jgi:hypothetical protein